MGLWGLVLACTAEVPLTAIAGVSVRDAPEDVATDFWAMAFPDDARLVDGVMPVAHLPGVADVPLLAGLAEVAELRGGASQVPVVYFPFGGAPAQRDPAALLGEVWRDARDDVVLMALAGPARGRPVPVVAAALPDDVYTPANVLAVAPRPGFVLRPATPYAAWVRRGFGDAAGRPLGVPRTVLARLSPDDLGDDRWAAHRDVREVLADADVPWDDVAAVARFTTGDAVAEVAAQTAALAARDDAVLSALAWFERPEETPSTCELHGTLDVPVYQRGVPPYNTDGRFVIGDDGLPVVQERLEIPVVVTIPHGEMPPAGFPLALYFHGSGGTSDQLVVRGLRPQGLPQETGKGPAWVLGRSGIAGAGSAHPVNPERVPGALPIAYLNFQNLAVFPYLFRQGVAEQVHYLDALLDLRMDPSALDGCPGPTLPPGATAFRFDPDRVVAMGQSMGGMYTNLVGAVEPRILGVAPTGAGGHWTRFILETELIAGAGGGALLLQSMLTSSAVTTFLHPGLHVGQLAWEHAEPLVFVPALAQRPLEGHPVRPIYEPVGLGDSYFPPAIYDAMAIAYGNTRVGERVWSSMDEALALDDRAPEGGYPVRDNRVSEDGTPYTGVVVQSAGDGYSDPHNIFVQVPWVREQWGCFLAAVVAGEGGVVLTGDDATCAR